MTDKRITVEVSQSGYSSGRSGIQCSINQTDATSTALGTATASVAPSSPATAARSPRGGWAAGEESDSREPYFDGLAALSLDLRAGREYGFAALKREGEGQLGEAWADEILRRVRVTG